MELVACIDSTELETAVVQLSDFLQNTSTHNLYILAIAWLAKVAGSNYDLSIFLTLHSQSKLIYSKQLCRFLNFESPKDLQILQTLHRHSLVSSFQSKWLFPTTIQKCTCEMHRLCNPWTFQCWLHYTWIQLIDYHFLNGSGRFFPAFPQILLAQ